MPKMMSHYTEMARRQLPASIHGDVIAAVPSTPQPTGTDMVLDAGVGAVAAIVPVAAALAAAVSLFLKSLVQRGRPRNKPAEQRLHQTLLLVFRRETVEIVELHRNGRRVGAVLESNALAGVSYKRTETLLDTRLTIGTIEWPIHGWFERDLRRALDPLGVELEQLPAAIPYKESEQ